jgi:hypothetical protein
MKPVTVMTWISAVLLALGSISLGFAAEDQQKESQPRKVESPDKKPSTAAVPPTAAVPVYKPPVRGAPGGRVGGGTRGRGADQTFMLSVLAPGHTGLTVQEQPVLYWYLSKQISSPMEFTLTDDGIKPLVEKRLSPPFQPGVQRVPLADYGVRLSPGKQYQWFVALVVDPERRSKDTLAGGTIERIEYPEALSVKLSQAGRSQAPQIYAEVGLWYDAVAAISDLIDAAPADTALRNQRASLLQQVGLTEIAEYDLKPRAAER